MRIGRPRPRSPSRRSIAYSNSGDRPAHAPHKMRLETTQFASDSVRATKLRNAPLTPTKRPAKAAPENAVSPRKLGSGPPGDDGTKLIESLAPLGAKPRPRRRR